MRDRGEAGGGEGVKIPTTGGGIAPIGIGDRGVMGALGSSNVMFKYSTFTSRSSLLVYPDIYVNMYFLFLVFLFLEHT